MSAATVLRAFASRFAVPYLQGGALTIGTPLGVDGFESVQHGMGVERDLVDACERQVLEAALFTDVAPADFDEDAATLLYAVHELYACCHPQTSSFYARAHLFCEAAEERVSLLPKTLEPSRLLTRHLIIQRAFTTKRTDVHVAWWTGRESFYGEEPPSRLTAWPGLRRVDVDRKETPMWRIALVDGDEETRVARSSLLVSLLHASPLTAMMLLGDPVLKELSFPFTYPFRINRRRSSPLYVLDDRRLARAVSDALLVRGVDHAGSMLSLSLLSALREGAPDHAVRRAAELCFHLFMMMALSEALAPGSNEARPLRALIDEEVTRMGAPLRVYWATVRSVANLAGNRFHVPHFDEFPDPTADVIRRALRRLDDPHIASVGDPLQRELLRRLSPAEELPSLDDDPLNPQFGVSRHT